MVPDAAAPGPEPDGGSVPGSWGAAVDPSPVHAGERRKAQEATSDSSAFRNMTPSTAPDEQQRSSGTSTNAWDTDASRTPGRTRAPAPHQLSRRPPPATPSART